MRTNGRYSRRSRLRGFDPRIGVAGFIFALSALTSAHATTIWIDTDCSIGSPLREVDDAFALALAFQLPDLRIAGVSTSYGNAPVTATTAATRDLLRRLSAERTLKPPAVFPGARSRHDLGVDTAATRALAARLSTDRALTYVCLGPLTNLATLQVLHPTLAARIRRVIFVGGKTEPALLRLGSRHALRIHDANVVKDPGAVRQVLKMSVPLTLVPIKTAAAIALNADDMRHLGERSVSGYFVRAKSRAWLWFWTKVSGNTGGPIFDAAAILAAADVSSVPLRERYAGVDLRGDLLISAGSARAGRRVEVCEQLPASARRAVVEALTR
ncbi:MAG: nucleoside hydrolase [Verrucomicrobiota bacterium]